MARGHWARIEWIHSTACSLCHTWMKWARKFHSHAPSHHCGMEESVYIHSVAVVEPFASHASHQSIQTGTHWRFISYFDVAFHIFFLYFFLSFGKLYIFLSLFQPMAIAHVECVCVCLCFYFICSVLFLLFLDEALDSTPRIELCYVRCVFFPSTSLSFHNNSLSRFHDVLFVPKRIHAQCTHQKQLKIDR